MQQDLDSVREYYQNHGYIDITIPEVRQERFEKGVRLVVVINDRGHFNFISDQRSGLLLGTGTLTIMNGQATGTTSTGIGTLTLHEKSGASVLVLEAALNDGNHYYVEMTQIK